MDGSRLAVEAKAHAPIGVLERRARASAEDDADRRQHRQVAGPAAADEAAVSNGRTSPAFALAGEAMPDRRFPPPWTIEDDGALGHRVA